jgi:DNA-binding GntR family transcriptional regulator
MFMMGLMNFDLELDRSSPIPLYFQLAQQLEHAVERGDLKPGDRIEPEIQLAERMGLSRPTVRQAIHELVRKGILVRQRGIGTQVVHNQLQRPVELSSLYDDLARAGRQPSTKVLSLGVIHADAELAVQLSLTEGETVHAIERVRFTGDQPLAYMRNWIPQSLMDLDAASLESHGLYELMRRAGAHMHVAKQGIGAKAASAAEAKILGVKTNAPLLTMRRTTFDSTGRTIEYASAMYRADLFSYETTLVAG